VEGLFQFDHTYIDLPPHAFRCRTSSRLNSRKESPRLALCHYTPLMVGASIFGVAKGGHQTAEPIQHAINVRNPSSGGKVMASTPKWSITAEVELSNNPGARVVSISPIPLSLRMACKAPTRRCSTAALRQLFTVASGGDAVAALDGTGPPNQRVQMP
jgi:hypothetical protein